MGGSTLVGRGGRWSPSTEVPESERYITKRFSNSDRADAREAARAREVEMAIERTAIVFAARERASQEKARKTEMIAAAMVRRAARAAAIDGVVQRVKSYARHILKLLH